MTAAERLELVEWYLEERWSLVLLNGKKPFEFGWEDAPRLGTAAAIAGVRKGHNVGVRLGEPSRGLVDVDLDSPEALRWAPRVLPPTLTFGRKSKPLSHYLYRAMGQAPSTFKGRDPESPRNGPGAMLVELRSTDAQTMAPPSIHPSGEPVEWTADPDTELAVLPGAEVSARVQALAALALTERLLGEEAAQDLARGIWPKGLPGRAAEKVREWFGIARPTPPARACVSCSPEKIRLRATRYLSAMPPSIEGSCGDDALWDAARVLVRGFDLSPDESADLLLREFNPRCLPPWNENVIRRKAQQVALHSDLPPGYLL